MSRFSIAVDFVSPAFHGLCDDGAPDWPPSPLRLASALMSGCHVRDNVDQSALNALDALVKLEPPEIITPSAVVSRMPSSYLPRSGLPATGTSGASSRDLKAWLDTSLVGLSTGHRVAKPSGVVILDANRLEFVVDDPAATVDIEALNLAARRIPYFGRSNDHCDVTVGPLQNHGDDEKAGVSWRGTRNPLGRTRGWAANSLTWMDKNHELTISGSELPPLPAGPYSTPLTYERVTRPTQAQVADSTNAPAVRTIALRKPLPSASGPALLAKLGMPEKVRVFPCVVAGHARSDGRILGVGLTADDPADLYEAEAQLIGSRPTLFAADGRIGSRRTLIPKTWSGPATDWISATPLRAFPDDRVIELDTIPTIGAMTGASIVEFSLSRSPSQPWQNRWPECNLTDGLAQWWLGIRFDRPVSGPLLAGRTKELGFGLFMPTSTSST